MPQLEKQVIVVAAGVNQKPNLTLPSGGHHEYRSRVCRSCHVRCRGRCTSWDNEPEILKEEFRRYAREAIALLEQEYADQLQEKEYQISYAA
jgi:hypothetical protein